MSGLSKVLSVWLLALGALGLGIPTAAAGAAVEPREIYLAACNDWESAAAGRTQLGALIESTVTSVNYFFPRATIRIPVWGLWLGAPTAGRRGRSPQLG